MLQSNNIYIFYKKKFFESIKTGRNGGKFNISKHIDAVEIIKSFSVKLFFYILNFP